MTKISRILKDYQESGAFSALVNVHAAIDDQTFLTKSGALLTVVSLEGPDDECLEASDRDRIARRFESAIRLFGPDFRLYQYCRKQTNAAIPARSYTHPVVQEAVANRLEYFSRKSDLLCSIETHFVVVYEGWKANQNLRGRAEQLLKTVRAFREAFSSQRKSDLLEKGLDEAKETLRHKVEGFIVQLPDSVHATVLDKRQAFRFLRGLVNYAPHKLESLGLKFDQFVDFQACDSELECHRDHLRLDDYYVQVLTLKEPPSQTFAHVLRNLNEIPCDFVAVSEWKREDTLTMRRRIQSMRRHFHNVKSSMLNYLGGGDAPKDVLVDDSAVGLVADLGACLQEIELKGRAFGQFSMTLILFSEDHAIVKRSAAECFKVFATHDAQLTEERYNLLNAWLGALPGNSAYNLRRFWLLANNYADLSFLFTPDKGHVENPHLGTEYLAVLETNEGAPYFLNLHYQDTAHSAVFGATGSGKSFLLNFLLTHLQKYLPFTYIFDLGGSYENLTQLFEGAYLSVGVEKRSFTINPFTLPPTPENLNFLLAFLKVLMESKTFHMSAPEEHDLYEQVKNLYVIEPGERRLFTLANMLSRNLRMRLQNWIEGGPYAALFDNVEDNLTFASFQTFDFERMDKVPQLLEPLLFYILHRANASIYDPARATTFKVFVMDEAWRFLRHPTIRLYILEALKTWRKKNAAMILATQSGDDLIRWEMLPVVVESCSTKMFLANPDLDRKTYRDVFHLNEKEVELIAGLIPKQQVLVKRPDKTKVVNLHVAPKDYWLYTSNPYDRERRREAFERYGFKQGLEILTGLPVGRQRRHNQQSRPMSGDQGDKP